MAYNTMNNINPDDQFGDLFGSDDEASDIDDENSQSSVEYRSPHFAETDSPPKSATTTHNDLDNLFGSEEEEEEEEEILHSKQALRHKNTAIESSDEERDKKQQSSDEQEEEEDYDSGYYGQATKQRVEVSLEMPQLPLPSSMNNKYYLAKIPRFLDVEVNPFVPSEFELRLEPGLTAVQQQEAVREQIESTIRWRRVVDEDGLETLQSNSHLVEWDDGKTSLVIGDEYFDVGMKPVGQQEHVYLLAHQTGSGALESQTEFTDHMTFRPSGLKSDTHRHITAQIADNQIKKNKTKMFYTEKDPELMKQELELQENERLKAQKKLELQRRKADMKFGDRGSRRNNDFGDYDTLDYDTHISNNHHQAQDRYEDDFVVDDDEYDEEEERSRESRLAQLKQSGMNKYNKRRHSDEEEEEEDYEEEEEDEEIVVRRPNKRHHLLSDEDE
ncbi:Leo1-like protein-domain-containing protein [Pilobolus umbonatus]|nr:Leo1-like protein-domain-containing protein [Pilobolus umbonatus]